MYLYVCSVLVWVCVWGVSGCILFLGVIYGIYTYVYSLNEIKSYNALSRAEHRVTRPDYGLPLSLDSHEPVGKISDNNTINVCWYSYIVSWVLGLGGGMGWKNSTYLFTILQLDKHTIIILGGNTLGKAAGCLNKHFQRAHQKLKQSYFNEPKNIHYRSYSYLIHFTIVVIIVPYPVDTLNVIPNGPTELGCIHILDAAHGAVGEIVGGPELLIQKGAHIVVQPNFQNEIPYESGQ